MRRACCPDRVPPPVLASDSSATCNIRRRHPHESPNHSKQCAMCPSPAPLLVTFRSSAARASRPPARTCVRRPRHQSRPTRDASKAQAVHKQSQESSASCQCLRSRQRLLGSAGEGALSTAVRQLGTCDRRRCVSRLHTHECPRPDRRVLTPRERGASPCTRRGPAPPTPRSTGPALSHSRTPESRVPRG